MTSKTRSPQAVPPTLDQTLQQAIAHHKAGQLQDAERLYRAILQAQPNHPDANHNLGVMAAQVGQHVAGIPHLKSALETNPAQGQYALSYAEALLATGQAIEALSVMQAAMQRGLNTAAAHSLRARAENATRSEFSLTESPTTGKSTLKKRNSKKDKSLSSKRVASPLSLPQAEIDQLVALFNAGRYVDLESRARLLLEQYPDSGFAWKGLGVSLRMQGKDALAALQKATKLLPDDADVYSNMGNALKDLGQLDDAVASYRRALQIKPNFAEAYSNLGNALRDLGQLDDAVASYRRALKIKPDFVEAHNNLGNALKDLGQLDDAVASCRRALQIKPDFAEARYNLGNVLKDLGQLDDAVASYRSTLEIKPDYAEAHSNLGNVLRDLGKLDAAVASYRSALETKPDYAEAHNNLGNTLQDLGQLDNAAASYRRALEIEPDSAGATYNLGNVLRDLGKLDDAVASYHRALTLNPDFANAHNNLGNALQDLGKLHDAVASYRRALEIKSDFVEAHNNLGNALRDLGQLDDAMASYYRAMQIKPDYALAHNNLGAVRQNLGQLDDAVASYRRALEIEPDFAGAHSNMLFCLSHNSTVDAVTLFSEHCRFGEQFEAPLQANWLQHTNSRDAERCLRIGFVSADLCNHPVANFIEPVLAHLSGQPRLSLHAYYNHVIEDSVTKRLRAYLPHWRQIVGLSDEALAQTIRADSIDILIDLSGHTAKNRLLTFAHKPAPVQASWMGYPGTTGLRAMDYYFSDRYLLPHEQFASQFTEELAYLPASAPFTPSKEAPPVNTLPAQDKGHVTFGSFNYRRKLGRSVIALWGKLLRTLPDSCIFLGGMPEEGNYDTLIDWFAQEGVARDRLTFHVRCGMASYLRLHHQVDICLDTFPYNGGTTTCHALWMGVPTLTLAGGTTASRTGAGILGHVGLDAFVAHDAEDFVQKGVSRAGDLGALSAIRAGLRERFTNSAMGQPSVVAEGLHSALRTMWQRWCAGLPAESFEVSLQDMNNEMQKADQ